MPASPVLAVFSPVLLTRGANFCGPGPKGGVPRRPREEEAGAMHHAFAHAVGREPLFVDDEDFELYLRLAHKVVAEFGWLLMSYCLMHNHMHLMVRTPDPNLGLGMQRLHGEYATAFNRRHERRGHRFDGRYGSRRIKSDA